MNFKELTQVWNNTSSQLEQESKLNYEILKSYTSHKVKKNISGIKYESIFELIVTLWFANFLVRFSTRNWDIIMLRYAAIFLIVLTVGSLSITIYKMIQYYKIRPNIQVLKMQVALMRLKAVERFEINLLYIIIPLFSLPFIAIFAKAFAGIDVFQFRMWLIGNVIGSIVIAIIIVYFLKRFPDQKLQESLDFLKEIKDEEGIEN